MDTAVLITIIRNSLGLWKSTLEAKSKAIPQFIIKCGLYRDDAWVLLLFCKTDIEADEDQKTSVVIDVDEIRILFWLATL